jgi:predicted transcriptional regulator
MSKPRRPSAPTPTKGELEILQALWRIGPATVRTVQAHLDQAAGYTTVLKLLQIMTEKGLVSRVEEARAHVYKAAVSEQKATGAFLRELLGRLFGGSAARLVAGALGATGKPSADEVKEIRRLLDEIERKGEEK